MEVGGGEWWSWREVRAELQQDTKRARAAKTLITKVKMKMSAKLDFSVIEVKMTEKETQRKMHGGHA